MGGWTRLGVVLLLGVPGELRQATPSPRSVAGVTHAQGAMGPGIGDGFGALLRRLRQSRSLSQEELAQRAGLAVTAVGALERGSRRRPYPHTVRALADALSLDAMEREALLSAVPRHSSAPSLDWAHWTSEPTTGGSRAVTPMFGREDDIQAVVALVAHGARRLVTLTGAGGVGKTRLAQAVVSRLAPQLPSVVVVELAAVRQAPLVMAAVARSLGAPERPGSYTVASLTNAVGDRRLLLVLDNVEQVLDCAPDIADLIGNCPRLFVLATSRAPLRIRAEHAVPVTPLGVPDAWAATDVDGIRAAPAVAMFLDRTSAMGAPIDVTSETAESVASIVSRLDGLPLAIELAAAGARLFDPATLLIRLDEAMMQSSLRDRPERQQTLAATLDWSVDLLSAEQQLLFAELATFDGGFTMAAAEAVGGPETLSHLGGLVDQSLVVRDPQGSRFRMLEPIRQYASARWSATPEATAAASRHARYMRGQCALARARLRGADLANVLDELDSEHANLRVAAKHLRDHGDPGTATAMAWDLWLFLAIRGHTQEWLDVLSGIDPASLADPARARWCATRGTLLFRLGNDIDQARRDAEASLALAAQLDDGALIAESATLAAFLALYEGDTQAADALIATARQATDSAGDEHDRIMVLVGQGQRAILDHDIESAEHDLNAAERLARTTGNGFDLAFVLNSRATITAMRGDDETAVRLLAESVERSTTDGLGWSLLFALPDLAAVAARRGEDEVAAQLIGASTTLTGSQTALGSVPSPRAAAWQRVVEDLRGRLGQDRYATAFDEGRSLDLPGVGALAARLRHPRQSDGAPTLPRAGLTTEEADPSPGITH